MTTETANIGQMRKRGYLILECIDPALYTYNRLLYIISGAIEKQIPHAIRTHHECMIIGNLFP